MIQLFISKNQLKGDVLDLSADDYHHLVRVLHVSKQESIRLVVDEKEIVIAQVREISKKNLTISVLEKKLIPSQNNVRIYCAQALPKQDKFCEILKFCTELGVDGFIPIESARSIYFSHHDAALKHSRWQTILKLAAEQSQRFLIPKLEPIQTLEAFIHNQTYQNFDLKLVLWEGEKKVFLKSVLRVFNDNTLDQNPSILLLTGPEGGFSEQEIQVLKEHAFVSVSIGNSILRTEHAAFAAVAMVLYEYL